MTAKAQGRSSGRSARPRPQAVRERDPDGRVVVHRRSIDTLARLHEAGVIDPAMLEAGRAFERLFAAAALDPLRAASLERVPGGGHTGEVTEGALRARRRLHAALAALGGLASPAGSAAWHVLGLGLSLREWALGRGWAGRPLRQEAAQGILVAALGVLAVHFGLAAVPRAG